MDREIKQLDVMIMKAATYFGKEDLRVIEHPVPVLDDGEVLLQIHACSVCGTDLRTYRHGDKKSSRRGSSAMSFARPSSSRGRRRPM